MKNKKRKSRKRYEGLQKNTNKLIKLLNPRRKQKKKVTPKSSPNSKLKLMEK